MGDKTQIMTIALAAEEAVKIGGIGWITKVKQIVPVWMGTTCGMMIADAFGIVVGIVLHKHIPEKLVKWIAAGCFAGFGLIGLLYDTQILRPHCNLVRRQVAIGCGTFIWVLPKPQKNFCLL